MHKENRLAKREDFGKVYRFGKSTANQQFVLYYMVQLKPGPFRAGVSVSKKLGNAVIRNRLRRMMKEIIRLHAERISAGMDLVFIARKPIVDMEYKEMEKCLLHVIRKAALISLQKQ